MPFDGPAAGIGGHHLTRFDLSIDENVRQAEFELRRCSTDFDFSRWARQWGEGAISRLRAIDAIPSEDHDAMRDAKVAIEDAADEAVEEIRALLKDSKGPKTEAITAVVEKFAAVLEEHEETEE